MAEYAQPPPKSEGPGREERQLLTFLDSLESESKSVEKEVKDPWEAHLAWFRGQQWTVRNQRPLFLANKIKEIVQRKAAKLTEMKPQLQIQARRRGLTATNKVVQDAIDAGWDEYGMQMVLSHLAYHMSIYGCGFLNITYDRSADFGRGDIVPGIFDPRYVHIDPSVQASHELDQAAYLWTESYMPTWEIRQRWPVRGELVSIAGPKEDSETSLRAHIKKIFAASTGGEKDVPAEAIPRSHMREYWFLDPTLGPDGTPLYPAGRRVLRGGNDVVLVDEPNPYYDGRWPLVMVDGALDPQQPWGISDVHDLKRLQDAVNRIGHIFVGNTLLNGNTWVTIDQNALTPTTLQRLSNIGAIIIEKMTGREVSRDTPPPMPPHLMGFVEIALALMDQLAGLADTTVSSQGRAEVRSDLQLEGLQQAAETLLRAVSRRIEAGLERFGQRWISRIFQFYTRDRILSRLGPSMEWQTFEFERAQLVKEVRQAAEMEALNSIQDESAKKGVDDIYEDMLRRISADFIFRVTPGSSLSSTRAARANLNRSLARDGLISGTYVLRDLGIPNPEQEIDRARQEMILRGAPPGSSSQNGSSSVRQAL